jgi:fructoselysine-6-P-deglycase FrlB-like protein
VAALAAEVGVQHRPEGVTTFGTPIGTDAYRASVVAERAAGVVAQVDNLMQLPLGAQSQFVLLRSSLAQRMAHLQRTLPWELLAASTRRVEQAVLGAVAAIFIERLT